MVQPVVGACMQGISGDSDGVIDGLPGHDAELLVDPISCGSADGNAAAAGAGATQGMSRQRRRSRRRNHSGFHLLPRHRIPLLPTT